MTVQNVGLVLEGGGMRGAYTSGVLTAMMDKNIKFSYIIGVSAGANNGANFIAEQRERNRKVFVDYVNHKGYSGFKYFLGRKGYFNMDFLFDKLPNELVPFDYDTFLNSPVTFKVCVTDSKTGKPVYFEKKQFQSKDDINTVLQASSSLPIISNPVNINGKLYFDGGISDSIPVEKSINDGNKYNVLVLTRNKGYRKKEEKLGRLGKILLKNYPEIINSIKKRHKLYNKALNKIDELERSGQVYVFRPIEKIEVSRLEKDVNKLQKLYEQGYEETISQIDTFEKWLEHVQDIH
ncbi:MAG: patatin family protein [Tissierellaceae bacterium]|jgi:predicted patatin/cPLA2 family phospholipase|nr:patatin family protein [Tissierellaceae bacterium]